MQWLQGCSTCLLQQRWGTWYAVHVLLYTIACCVGYPATNTQVRVLQTRLLQQLHREALLREVEGQGYAIQHVEGDVFRAALPCKVC